jgi:site-specific recombinase XerD
MSIRRPFQLPGRKHWYIDINRKRRSLGTEDFAEALKMYNEIAARYKMEVTTPETIHASPGLTLQQFNQQYMEWSQSTRLPSTFRAERLALQKLLASAGPKTKITALTPQHLDTLTAELRKAGLTVTSVNHFSRHLKSIFSRAEAWQLVKENPFRKVKLIRQQQGPPRRLTVAELPKLFSKITDPELESLVRAYLATGRRRSELLSLTWDCIDLVQGRYYVAKSKDHLSRWYPISKAFRAVLDAIPQPHNGFIFRWRSPDTATHLVKQAFKEAGFPDLHLHHLRHSFGAMFIEAGGDLRTLMELMGHRQISTTLIYTRLTNDHLSKEIDRVDLGESGKSA